MAFPIAFGRDRDVFVMGRANVDMYVTDPADSLETAVLFEKSVGGSAANIAVGLSRLGRQVSMISRVSADPFGEFVRHFLNEAGVDCQHVDADDSGARTSLAFAERRVEESQVLFYRNNAADLRIQPQDLPEKEWAKTSLLVVTGTGLSASPSREATLSALESARGEGCRTVLDLDWREAAWNNPSEAPFFYNQALSQSDVVIGTVEEFSVLDQNIDWIGEGREAPAGVQKILQGGTSLVVVKRGKLGSAAYTDDGNVYRAGIYPVSVAKNYGAGDAFAAAFLHGLLQGDDAGVAMDLGAAAAAIVVSSVGCASSAPNLTTLEDFRQQYQT
ncbi:MAG: 5-dehydro-2-deoxygluconokinase [Spirochaetales bacterium]|nr:5-dehydro-2-deoxygluconokinase [Spirochaetales bacterium]